MLVPLIFACSLVSPARVSAVHDPFAELTAATIDLGEPEHGHDEHDTSLLEHRLIDVTVPTITGGFVMSHESPVLLQAANRGMKKWWATTPLGKSVVFHVFLSKKQRNKTAGQLFT
jgi:hypothetical protein